MRSLQLFLLFFFTVTFDYQAGAQIFPSEGGNITYRMIGFGFPADSLATGYKLELARGICNSEDSFKKYRFSTLKSTKNRTIAEVPSFGSDYTWRTISLSAQGRETKSAFHHFTVGTTSFLDSDNVRIPVTKSAEKYKDAYFFMDGTKALYDMNGKPVWFLPEINERLKGNSLVRDMKLTEQGTITFLVAGDAYEINYNGELLWTGPSGRQEDGDTLKGYHHELTRRSNGHYMIMGFEPMPKWHPAQRSDSSRMAGRTDTSAAGGRRNAGFNRKPRYGTVVEYDEQGKVVWTWNAAKYFEGVDLAAYKKMNGMPEYDVHQNSFYFDEKEQMLYVSFRNISQVLKITYPGGEVVRAYGSLKPGQVPGNGLFCGQHSCKISQKGHLYLFDNGCDIKKPPKIVVMQQAGNADTLKRVWEYACPVKLENVEIPKGGQQFTSGGNVMEMPDQSMFVSTCSPYGKVFIVSPAKKILWSIDPEQRNGPTDKWRPLHQYRASIIPQRKQLESLIWNSFPK